MPCRFVVGLCFAFRRGLALGRLAEQIANQLYAVTVVDNADLVYHVPLLPVISSSSDHASGNDQCVSNFCGLTSSQGAVVDVTHRVVRGELSLDLLICVLWSTVVCRLCLFEWHVPAFFTDGLACGHRGNRRRLICRRLRPTRTYEAWSDSLVAMSTTMPVCRTL